MDLRTTIQSTLSADATIRSQAETALKQAEQHPGFIGALLDILQSEQDPPVRLSVAVYLKNRISRGWATEHTPHQPISEPERKPFRDRLLPVLSSSPPLIRAQLIPILQTILQYDFPTKWPELMDITLQLLNTQDANQVYAGLQCLLAVCRTYRFRAGEERQNLDKVVNVAFPTLLVIGNKLVNETSLEAGEMLRICVKCYKHAVYYGLPVPLQSHQATVDWCTLFLTIISKEPPETAMPEDAEDRERNHWWKARKWSYANLNRLFVRYGNPSALSSAQEKEYGGFAKNFITNFAPEILKGYLGEIEKWVGGNHWLSKPSLSYTLIFLEECVKPKVMWDKLKPHMDSLIKHLIFPVMCLSDDDLELFTDNPADYLHRKLNYYEEVSAPDMAATNFLIALTKSRKQQTYVILSYVNEVVSRYESAPDDQKNPREKDGALRMIGSLASVILGKKSPIADQVEYFFVRHVFPEFRSPHGFLRARACETMEKFEQLDFKDQNNLMIIYQNIMESMADPELPVRVEASLALQPLIRHDAIRLTMQSNIPQIMHQLLQLMNEVDVDSLSNVMEDFVEVFAEQLTPFAVALSTNLRDTYLRIVREILERNEARAAETGDAHNDYLDDKSIAALGVLQTIGTLILTLEATPDVLLLLESILMPVITITLENKLYDLYNEVFEIIDSCTYASKSISPTMWQAFELMHKTFKDGAELYLEDMLPALDNFVAYGPQRFIEHPPYLAAIGGMVRDIFSDPKVGGVDRICGCKLAEAMMLNLRGGPLDSYIPTFVTLPMEVLTSAQAKTVVKSYKLHLVEMVINCLYYNPILALQVLESHGWTNKFFSIWFGMIDNFRRVHDKKLCLAAICSLLTIRAEQVPHSVQTGWPRLLTGATYLFRTLPAAIKQREEAVKASDGVSDTISDYGSDDDAEDWADEPGTEGGQEWGNVSAASLPDTKGDIKDESQAYLDFLSEEAKKFGALADDDDDSVLDDDSLLESPLDKFDPYSAFKESLDKLQAEQPQLYQNLTAILEQGDRDVLQSVVNHAAAAQAAQVQQAQAAQG